MDDSSARHEETFRQLMIPEIFSKILRNITARDRLQLRLVSRATENAVALTDMHIAGSPQIIYMSSGRRSFKVHFGLKKDRTTLKLRRALDDLNQFEHLEEFARIKERLFARVYTNYVDITKINFNRVPVAFVERILDGCFFEELEIKIDDAQYNADVFDFLLRLDSDKCKRTKLTLINILPGDLSLISLNPMLALVIKKTTAYIEEEIFIELVTRGHAYLNVPIIITSVQAISDVKKILEDSTCEQVVKFAANASAIEQFLTFMGFKMVRKSPRQISKIIKSPNAKPTEQVHLEMGSYTNSDEWNGSFDLYCETVKIAVEADYSFKRDATRTVYTMKISNNHCPSEDSFEYDSGF